MLDTEDLNILPKNLAPVEPPGIEPNIIHINAITCAIAHSTVQSVLSKYKAQYNVAINVKPYSSVLSTFSLENSDFICAHGPYRKLKL